ncbi:hypothetical protein ALP52_00850 [Pseudomonas amygdali pv. mori]|uniref:Uncharacterized protein n=1 Tax=Pseudomonas amygdali pv. mori TaxID=34065 RepID=A0A3M5INY8_PSEA0|nr:hypothetical protein [Pseudomonas amygdali]RMT12370.1 hypothetical protein ALP52_00850 [Pseudomonas amygdali pv. mori]
MKHKLPFALFVGGVIVFPPIVSKIINTSLFMSWGFSAKIAFALYVSLTFFIIASTLTLIYVAGTKLSKAGDAKRIELERISEREEPHVGKPASGKIRLSKTKEIATAAPKKKEGWFSSFADDLSSFGDSGVDSGGGGDGGGGGD